MGRSECTKFTSVRVFFCMAPNEARLTRLGEPGLKLATTIGTAHQLPPTPSGKEKML